MAGRKYQPLVYDTVAAIVLIVAGLAGMIVRLGVLDFVNTPGALAVEHALPLALIGMGATLLSAQHRAKNLPEVPHGK